MTLLRQGFGGQAHVKTASFIALIIYLSSPKHFIPSYANCLR